MGADNLKTYWQPIYTYERNLSDIRKLEGRIENIHVYNWIYGERTVRKMLSDNFADWKDYVAAIKNRPYILEFAKDDSIDNFLADAGTLTQLTRSFYAESKI